MNIKQHKNKMLLFLITSLSLFSCNIQKGLINNSCRTDKVYLELMDEAGINTRKLKKNDLNCQIKNISPDSLFVQQFYSDVIFFEGYLIKGNKTGQWNGYYKDKLFVKVSYLGEPKNRPVFIDLWNIEGKHIRQTNLSIIE